ncbi:hypothetical protein ACMT1E_04300 [Sphingomonas flavalba]|uniref:hypothetical protein n=1 Tax=Sphingomonas flavalba TaxID=2559804 RepID=UPI0039E16E9C
MALNYSIHNPSGLRTGAAQPLPFGPLPGRGQVDLAENTASGAIAGPCEVRLLAGEDCRVDMRGGAGDLAPAGSPFVLKAGQPEWIAVPMGETCYLSWAALT